MNVSRILSEKDKIFVQFFFLSFLINAIGIFSQQLILCFWIIVLAPFVVTPFYKAESTAKSLKTVAYLFSLVIGISLLSTIFSIDVRSSVLFLLFYILCGGVFLVGLGLSRDSVRLVFKLTIAGSFILVIYSQVIVWLLNLGIIILLPQNGYQLVYSKFGSHNHLGDFLAVMLVLLMTSFLKNRLYILSRFIFFVPFIFSYSRSAYVAFLSGILCWFMLSKKVEKTKKIFGIIVVIIMLMLLVSTIRESRSLPIFGGINHYFSNNFSLGDKVFAGTRMLFIYEAFELIRLRPLVGFGPGTYEFAISQLTLDEDFIAETSHNLILDFAVEQGLTGALTLTLLIILCLMSASKSSPFFYAVVALLINFLFDYTFRIPGMLLLFCLFLGISISEKTSNLNDY